MWLCMPYRPLGIWRNSCIHSFLTLTLNGSHWSAARSDHAIPRERYSGPIWIWGLGGSHSHSGCFGKKMSLIATINHIITLQSFSLYPQSLTMISSSYTKYVQMKMRAAYCALSAENLQIDEIWLLDVWNPNSKEQYTVNYYCSVAMDNKTELIQYS